MDLVPEKRKRVGDDDDAEKKMITKKKNADAEPEEAEEEQVEEFCAILRRIHAAVKHFEKAGKSGRSLTAATWNPSFEVEDFEEDGRCGVKDLTEDSSGLDLNSEPAIEVQQRNVA